MSSDPVVRPGLSEADALPLDGRLGEPGRPTLSDLVVADIQTKILAGEFEPAQPLPSEAKLCQGYGVSRSVIRDAIRTLAARGFVDVERGRGTSISEPSDAALGFAMLAQIMRSDTTMGEILEMRATVEGQLLPLATQNRTDEDCQRVAQRFAQFENAVDDQKWRQAHERHLEFHLELVAAVGLPGIGVFMRPMHEIINLSSWPPEGGIPGLWEVDVHRAILSALQRRDSRAMTDALEQHFDFMRREPYLTLRKQRFRDAVRPDALRQAFRGIAAAGTFG